MLEAVASQQSAMLAVLADDLLAKANTLGLAALKATGTTEHLAGRVAERKMRDTLMLSMPDRQSMIAGRGTSISISVASTYPAELAKIRGLITAGDIDGIVSRYPARESGIFGGLAKGLRFIGQRDYEKAALTRIGGDKTLQSKLKTKLGNLAVKLA